MMARRRSPHADDRRRRDTLLGGFVLLGALAAAYLSTVAIDGGPLADPYTVRVVLPAGAPLLKDGDDVRIAGVRAGVVRGVRPATARDAAQAAGAHGPLPGGDRPTAAVGRSADDATTASRAAADRRPTGTVATLALDDGPLGRDARASVRLRGVAGAVYVDVRPGDVSQPLADGAILAGRAAAATQLTDVAAVFDVTTRRAVRRTVAAAGEGLRGRGDVLNHVVAALPGALDRATPLGRSLTPTPGALARLLGGASPVLRATDADGALAGIAPALLRVVAAVPTGALRETVRSLPPAQDELRAALPEADRLLDEAGTTADLLRPATAAFADALPATNGALAGIPGIQAFRRTGVASIPVIERASPLLRDARDPAALLAPLAVPLGPLVAHLAPYRTDIVEAVRGFDRWGNFAFDEGAAKGARAVRFSMVLTCHRARDPYPAPGVASTRRKACP